ncbi:MAG: ATP-binding protein [Treponema sp.]|jgi:predicted kinase|nr:ATP-binding protein [Treponema sp.]
MKLIFALCGKPGAGKTALATRIAGNYKSVIFSADKIMLKLFGEIAERSLFEQKLKLCKEIIYETSDGILANSNLNIIFDFGFWTRDERKALINRFNKYKVIFIYLNVNDDILWERIENRNKNLKEGEYRFDREMFNFLSKLFDEFDDNEEYIIFKNIPQLKSEIRNIISKDL